MNRIMAMVEIIEKDQHPHFNSGGIVADHFVYFSMLIFLYTILCVKYSFYMSFTFYKEHVPFSLVRGMCFE